MTNITDKKSPRWDIETPPDIYSVDIAWPKISVVVPSFNQAEFLERSLKSIIDQHYPNLELIVIDGGSIDGSVEIIKKYESYISYWVSEKDNGQAQAINKGFKRASGSLFAWLNSDDCYNAGAFFKVAKASLSYPSSDLFYGDALHIDVNDNILSYWHANFVWDRYLRFGGLIASHSAFWRSKAHQPLCEELYCNIDGELWIRMIKGLKCKYINYPLGTNRYQPNSKSVAAIWKEKWEFDSAYIEKKYGPPPKANGYFRYEYQYVQRIFSWYQKIWGSPKLPF